MDKVSDFAPHEAVEVLELPDCDICGETAAFDAKTVNGPWANLCPAHYARLGYGLGLGKGQRLILKGSSND